MFRSKAAVPCTSVVETAKPIGVSDMITLCCKTTLRRSLKLTPNQHWLTSYNYLSIGYNIVERWVPVAIVKVSPKYQAVIPQKIRAALGIEARRSKPLHSWSKGTSSNWTVQ